MRSELESECRTSEGGSNPTNKWSSKQGVRVGRQVKRNYQTSNGGRQTGAMSECEVCRMYGCMNLTLSVTTTEPGSRPSPPDVPRRM